MKLKTLFEVMPTHQSIRLGNGKYKSINIGSNNYAGNYAGMMVSDIIRFFEPLLNFEVLSINSGKNYDIHVYLKGNPEYLLENGWLKKND